MKLNLLKFTFIYFLFFSFKPIPIVDTCQHLNKISSSFSIHAKEKFGLITVAKGGSLRGGFESINLSFQGYFSVDFKHARKLYLELAEDLISKINKDKTFRPYLHQYPTTIKNLAVAIFFKNATGDNVKPGEIALIMYANDRIIYDTYDKNGNYVNLYIETYEEALKINAQEKLYLN